ncbi:ankyrin repeat domain-containing protein 13A isoform X2 [Pseudophryne corroboree]|uniref:ankyrin repeat domain-containing protein 13A isoform X2 n=1 Tax=Pseudophryne corroboree TaxID=495146 RepID=UPI0030820228
MSSGGEPHVKYPLHALVWENDFSALERELEGRDIEELDPRGRTPLHLAVSLGHLESARVLLRHKADVTKENRDGWTVLHEAVSTGDPEMVQMVLQYREFHKTSTALGGVPELLKKTLEASDFYVEMKWEFTSWDNWAELMEINHDDRTVTKERFDISQEIEGITLDSMQPAEREVSKRLTSPVINTSLDTTSIAFERTKSGFWGWRTDKEENVNNYEAKVYSANNVNVVTKTRTEHLTEEEKSRYKADRNFLESLLGTVEHQFGAQGDLTTEFATANNPTAITPDEYFNPDFDLKNRDIGRPKELAIRTQKFRGTLWMCEDFPLSLVEQVTPIIDLMARTSSHFAHLRDFITLQFPPGFPVKIEIPLFHVLNARITFGNVNTCTRAEEATTPPTTPKGTPDEATAAPKFEVDQSVFDIPPSYHIQENGRSLHIRDEDDEIMQFAIQQSLLECSGSQPISQSHSNGSISSNQVYDAHYERALQESILANSQSAHSSLGSHSQSFDKDLQFAMELSAKEVAEQEKRRLQEEAELEEILRLSIMEK